MKAKLFIAIDATYYDLSPVPNGWSLLKRDGAEYIVTANSCGCEHFQRRLKGTGQLCKHQQALQQVGLLPAAEQEGEAGGDSLPY